MEISTEQALRVATRGRMDAGRDEATIWREVAFMLCDVWEHVAQHGSEDDDPTVRQRSRLLALAENSARSAVRGAGDAAIPGILESTGDAYRLMAPATAQPDILTFAADQLQDLVRIVREELRDARN